MPENEPKNKSNETYVAILMAAVFWVVGIGILVLTTHVAQIKGDWVLVALLLIPVFIYLAIIGKLKGFTMGPLSASFIESKVEDIKNHVEENVTGIVEYENRRSMYLGKLSQILKENNRFCLIYADVDFLRQRSRETFLNKKKEAKSIDDRCPESEIRDEIIEKLNFALADAFCEKEIEDAKGKDAKKYDIFNLTEPDVVMIAREVNLETAKSIAEQAQKNFTDYSREGNVRGYTATIAIVSNNEDTRMRELDKIGLKRLHLGKKHKRKDIYTVTLS